MKIKEEFKNKVRNINEDKLHYMVEQIEKENSIIFPIFGLCYVIAIFIFSLFLIIYQKTLVLLITLPLFIGVFLFFVIYSSYLYYKIKKMDFYDKASYYLMKKWYDEDYFISDSEFESDEKIIENVGFCYKNRFLKLKNFYLSFYIIFIVLLFALVFLYAFIEEIKSLIFFLPLIILISLFCILSFVKKSKDVKNKTDIEIGRIYLNKDRRIKGNNHKIFCKRKKIYISLTIIFSLVSLIFLSIYINRMVPLNYDDMLDVSSKVEDVKDEKDYKIYLENDKTCYVILAKYVSYLDIENSNDLIGKNVSLKVTPKENDISYIYYVKLDNKEILSEEDVKTIEKKEKRAPMVNFYLYLSLLSVNIIFWLSDYFSSKYFTQKEYLVISGEK